MARVRELGLQSVAFPALGTGIGGFPLDEAARVAVDAVREELRTPSSIEHVIFALRGAAAYDAFAAALSAGEPAPRDRSSRPPPPRTLHDLPDGAARRTARGAVEAVAREIRLRGLTGPAVHFLEASRPYRPLGAPAMLFFDPTLRELFGGETPSATELLRDDTRDRGAHRPARGAGRVRRLGRLTARPGGRRPRW